jgi:GcrA cell cycle regulator
MWTDTQVDTLRALCAPEALESLSAEAIAKRIGRSRNAVIGKVARLHLALPNARTAVGSTSTARPTRAARAEAFEHPERGRSFRPVSQRPPEKRTAPEPVKEQPIDALVYSPLRVTIADLNPNMCKWPLGDPSDFDLFRYCGLAATGVYCRHHTKLAYQPHDASGRRRAERL